MAITATNLTLGSNPDATASIGTTASIAPSANQLVIVSAIGGAGGTNTPTVTGAGGTWVQIATVTDSGGNRRVTLFRDLSASPGSGALTIDFQAQNQAISWIVDGFMGTDLSGTHGSGAIVQSITQGTASVTATGLTLTLAALGANNNVAFGAIRNGTVAAITKGSLFTELAQQNLSGGPSDETEFAVNQTSVVWTWASQTTFSVAVALEMRAALAPPWVTNPYSLMPDHDWF